jgi:phosphoribosylamine--glycine ligase
MMQGGRVGSEAAGRVVIEETLAGREASLLLWTDGRDYKLMPPARDHKRVGEGDTGPNTGGMGAVTSPDVLDEETLARCVREIVEPTLEGARADGLDFRGVLFVGLMLTGEGPRVLEYNVRFGDPETQAILPRLRSDLLDLLDRASRPGGLEDVSVEWSPDWAVTLVLASRGYPESSSKGDVIGGLDSVPDDVEVLHAGTGESADGSLVTAGGRVLNVTALGSSPGEARDRAYEAADGIEFDGKQLRRDIAARAVERVEA